MCSVRLVQAANNLSQMAIVQFELLSCSASSAKFDRTRVWYVYVILTSLLQRVNPRVSSDTLNPLLASAAVE